MPSTISSPYFLGGRTNVAIQKPLDRKGPPVRYWAERGLVHWEHSRDNSYGTMRISDALKRLSALSDMCTRSSEQGDYSDERREMQRFIEQMVEVIRQAKEQGSPFSRDAVKAAKRARPVSIIKPVIADIEL